MRFDWSTLGGVAPRKLIAARTLAHRAVQWPSKAARASLTPVADDSHSSLEWDTAHAALVSMPLPARGGAVRVGLRIASLELLVLRAGEPIESRELHGADDAHIASWI